MLPPHLEVELVFTPTEEGGRHYPVRSGYLVPHDFYGDGIFYDAMHQYTHDQEVKPGDTVRALVTLKVPELHRGRLCSGMTFTVREGEIIVAKGRIIRVLDQSLIIQTEPPSAKA